GSRARGTKRLALRVVRRHMLPSWRQIAPHRRPAQAAEPDRSRHLCHWRKCGWSVHYFSKLCRQCRNERVGLGAAAGMNVTRLRWLEPWWDRARLARTADLLVILIALSLPWSTSATAILI